jgi:NitT/TauT family transport system ATP-binding protein
MAPMNRLRIDIREKAYPAANAAGKRHLAIRDLQIELDCGEFVCLVGPSGCGKTTLLNIVAGLDQRFQGSVEWDAPPVMAYVFQNPRLLPWRTVRENIELVLPAEADGKLAERLLDAMGLLPVQAQYPQRLSLGMCRRVALARAFAVRPTLLLMDEPFVSLDAPAARRMRELLLAAWMERPCGVLFVTHDLREAIALADRLIFLSAPPTAVVREVAVDIPRERRGEETAVAAFRERLVESDPRIRALV